MLSRLPLITKYFVVALSLVVNIFAVGATCTLNGKPVEPDCFKYNKCPAESGRMICKNEKGTIYGEWEIKQGKHIGYQTTYFDDGSKVEQSVDELGKFDGIWEKRDSSGNLIEADRYSHGERDGRSAQYFPSGKIKMLSWWKNGMRNFGASYFADGRLSSLSCSAHSDAPEAVSLCGLNGKASTVKIYNHYWIIHISYLNGEEVSRARFDTKTGTMVSSKTTTSDGQATKKYYPNGALQWEGAYKNGRLDGVEKEYHESGKLIRQSNWQYGEEVDSNEYYLNGQKSYSESRTKQGSKWLTAIKTYFDNGKLSSEFSLLDGNYVGEDRGYNENGKLVYAGIYDDKGKLTREKRWDNSGKLISDEPVFDDGSRKSNSVR